MDPDFPEQLHSNRRHTEGSRDMCSGQNDDQADSGYNRDTCKLLVRNHKECGLVESVWAGQDFFTKKMDGRLLNRLLEIGGAG